MSRFVLHRQRKSQNTAKNRRIFKPPKRDIESVTLGLSKRAPNNVTPSHGVVVTVTTVTNVTHVTHVTHVTLHSGHTTIPTDL